MAGEEAPPSLLVEGEALAKLEKEFASEQRACRKHAALALESSPMLHYLLRAMDDRGCKLASDFVSCVPVPKLPVLGAFEPGRGRVLLNSATARDQKTVTRTLLHELVHAFDDCRVHLDYGSCRHLACTEVRAANLSDDCAWSAELRRGHFGFRKGHRKCVHRRATLSIQNAPACDKQKPEHVVSAVFRRCYRDTEPFPAAPE